jgi:hypothetical protein
MPLFGGVHVRSWDEDDLEECIGCPLRAMRLHPNGPGCFEYDVHLFRACGSLAGS